MRPMLERLFKLSAHRTTVHTEIIAGFTTFAAMAYILAVNPAILSAAGMDAGALISATALASALMTALMGLMTNYPIALAPGMGMNAFFAFTICGAMKIPWQAALGMVFVSGLLFLLLSVSGLRQKIIESIPQELKIAIACGIGSFITFLGLKNGGIIVSDPATFVTVGKIGSPAGLLVLFGIVLTAVLYWRKVRGAIIISILALTIIGLFLPAADGKGNITAMPERLIAAPASLAPTFLALDLKYVFANLGHVFPVIFALLFVDLVDNMGTLIGVCHRAGFLDKDGNFPQLGRAMAADATAAMVGSCLGTSTVTSYIESAAGVEEGGRTGLTSMVVSICFLLALFFHPLIRAIPAVATAPALVVVGIFMMQSITDLDLKDFTKAMPALLIMVIMPLAFSINEAISIGFVVYVAFAVGTGRSREISWMSWLLSVLFLLHLWFR
ncbi:MAG TPA: NCS2 family permease [Verrucomicrobiae bacterium]|nr:NCS2 family permease [Verrucomicrobiae bacterium]